jgi:hypothetical protein
VQKVFEEVSAEWVPKHGAAWDQADIEGECRRTYGGPLVLAQDLMRLVLD